MKLEKKEIYKIILSLKQDALKSEKEQKEDLKRYIKSTKNIFNNIYHYWNGYLDALYNMEKSIKKTRKQTTT